jgi:hypothetical protein
MTRKTVLSTIVSILFDREQLPKSRTTWTAGNRR